MSENNGRRLDRDSLQHQAEHTRPRRRAPLTGYLVILFAAAFLLLLMAYFQQQRQSSETTDALKQSVSAVDALRTLMDDNESLRAQVEELEGQRQELKEQNGALDAQAQDLAHTLLQTQAAMDYFWQIDEAYVRGRYGLCRDLIQVMEDVSQGQTPLKDYLSHQSVTDTDRYSPADRYREIYNALY